MTQEQIKTNLNEILDFIKVLGHKIPTEYCGWDSEKHDWIEALNETINTAEQERIIGHCKDCKYFEYDSMGEIDGIPLIIVAHEICNKWGNGCKTKEDGYCFLFESQESEDKE